MEERLQKWIARCGISSRRAAEELLRQGRVTLNGRVAGLGESGDPERDTLLVDGRPVAAAPEPVYLMLNKPRGYVTTLSDERGRKTAAELVADCGRRVFPVRAAGIFQAGHRCAPGTAEFYGRGGACGCCCSPMTGP